MADDPTTPETGTPSTPAKPDALATLPDDHPLVKAHAAKKSELADAKRKIADLENAGKTADEKVADRLAALESKLSDAETANLRLTIANANGIPQADAALFLTGSDEETLRAQAKRLVERDADKRKRAGHVPGEGSTPLSTDGQGELREFARNLFKRD